MEPGDIRRYQVHLLEEGKLGIRTVIIRVAAHTAAWIGHIAHTPGDDVHIGMFDVCPAAKPSFTPILNASGFNPMSKRCRTFRN